MQRRENEMDEVRGNAAMLDQIALRSLEKLRRRWCALHIRPLCAIITANCSRKVINRLRIPTYQLLNKIVVAAKFNSVVAAAAAVFLFHLLSVESRFPHLIQLGAIIVSLAISIYTRFLVAQRGAMHKSQKINSQTMQ